VQTASEVVDREIGTAQRWQESGAPKTRCTANEILCSLGGIQFCAKQLISEFSFILSPESGIFRARKDGKLDISIEVQQMHQALERLTPDGTGRRPTSR
jgi:hypothetical protein